MGEAASFTGCVVWREHPWQSSSPALRVLLPLIALNFPSISYPRPLFFGYSFNSSLTISINFASLWLLFFSPSLLTPLFLPSVLTPTPPTIRTIHRSPDTWSPFTEPQTCCSPSLEAPTPPSPPLPANCYSFSMSQDRHNFPSWVCLALRTFSWDLTPLRLPSFKKKKNQMTLYLLIYMSVPPWTVSSGIAENTASHWGTPCSLSSTWLEQGSIIDFWVCVLHTEAIGGGLKNRILLPILLLLSHETSTGDFSFHVAVSCFIKRSYSSKVTIIFSIL